MPGEYSVIGAVLDENGNVCPVKTAFGSISASTTDGVLVAAVAGKKIRVIAFVIVAGPTATTCTFNSKGAGAGTAISMSFQNGANGGVSRVGGNGIFFFQTNPGEALTITTGTGVSLGVQVTYCET